MTDKISEKEQKSSTDYLGFLVLCSSVFFLPLVFLKGMPDSFIAPKQYFINVSSVLLIILLTIKIYQNNSQIRISSLSLPLGLFCGWCLATIFWNYNKICGLRELGDTLSAVLFFFFTLNFVKSVKMCKQLLVWMIVSGLIMACINYFEGQMWYFRFDPQTLEIKYATDELVTKTNTGYKEHPPKPGNFYFPFNTAMIADRFHKGATIGNKNALAEVFSLLSIISFALLLSAVTRFEMIFLIISLFIFCRAILFLSSLSAMFGLACGGLSFLILLIFNFSSQFLPYFKRFSLFFWIGLILLVLILSSNQFPWKRLKNLDNDISKISRLKDYQITLHILRSNLHRLFYGFGFGSYKHFFPEESAKATPDEEKDFLPDGISRHAHSDWIQCVAELGVIGFCFWLFLIWKVIKLVWDSTRQIQPNDFTYKTSVYESFNFLFLKPFFKSTPTESSIKNEIQHNTIANNLVLVWGCFSSLIALLMQATVDFPFQRMIARVFTPVLLGIISVLAEKESYSAPEFITGKKRWLLPMLVLIMSLAVMRNTWYRFQADKHVGMYDAIIRKNDPHLLPLAGHILFTALEYDSLPGYALLKMAGYFERIKRIRESFIMAELSLKNINLREYSVSNHSVMIHLTHLSYDVLKNPILALPYAEKGFSLTCGFDRCIFYYYLINCHLDTGNLTNAEKLFLQWSNSPHATATLLFAQSGEKLGYFLGSYGKWNKALKIADVGLSLLPQDPKLLRLKGNALLETGNINASIDLLRQAISENPEYPIAKRDLARALFVSGQIEKAINLLENCLSSESLSQKLRTEMSQMLESFMTKKIKTNQD